MGATERVVQEEKTFGMSRLQQEAVRSFQIGSLLDIVPELLELSGDPARSV